MIEIQKLYLRNFRSYGDYDTEINLDGLGPILILGEINNNENERKNSNGAGKSTIPDSIIWCLFGKLPYKDRPADAVVNWETNKNCKVKITTKDGHQIIRTRKMEGENSLTLIDPHGNKIEHGITENTQKFIERTFNIEYETFTSSTFFTQFDKPILERSEIKRRKILERMLNLHKYNYYAEVAKEKETQAKTQQEKENQINQKASEKIMEIERKINKTEQDIKQHEEEREKRIKQTQERTQKNITDIQEQRKNILQQLINKQEELSEITTHDLNEIKRQWNKYEENEENKKTIEEQIRTNQEKTEKIQIQINHTTTNQETNDQTETIQQEIQQEEQKLQNYPTYDHDLITHQITQRNQTKKTINTIEEERNTQNSNKAILQQEIIRLTKEIKEWEKKENTLCPECEQPIQQGHISQKTKPTIKQLQETNTKLQEEIIKIKETEHNLNEKKQQYQKENEKIPELTIVKINTDRKNETKERLQKLKTKLQEEKQKQERHKTENEEKLKKIQEYKTQLNKTIKSTTTLKETLNNIPIINKPIVTITEADLQNKRHQKHEELIKNIEDNIETLKEKEKETHETTKQEIQRIKQDKNPFITIKNDYETELKEARKSFTDTKNKLEKYDIITKHFEFLKKSFSDKKKIKSYTIATLIPHLNEKISFYLQAMNCDFNLSFNEYLQTTTKTYPYEYWSGGERRRIDISIMMAIHSLHELIHEKQSNILVFDEVERSLEPNAIESFIELIFNEFNNKTVLVISHSEQMLDAFPKKMIIQRTDRYKSTITEVR